MAYYTLVTLPTNFHRELCFTVVMCFFAAEMDSYRRQAGDRLTDVARYSVT